MPGLDAIKSSVSQLPNGPPLVVALPGGTTGIGSYVAKAFATAYASHGSKLRVYIIGRNSTRAVEVIAEAESISPGSEWRFIKATDLALMSEVDRCSAELIRQEREAPFHGGPIRLDLLYMTACYPILKERTTTTEGLDTFISLTYYSRIRFITQLLPLLEASPLPAHVISVYAGGFEDGTSPGEEPIGCPPDEVYTLNTVRKYSTFMKTFMFEQLAENHAGRVRFTHIYPGLVDGPGFLSPDMPLWFRLVWRVMKPLAWLYMTSPDDCGQVMAYLATAHFPAKGQSVNEGTEPTPSTQDIPGGGAYGVGQRADSTKGVRYEKVRKEDTTSKVWDHTMEVLNRIEKKNAEVTK